MPDWFRDYQPLLYDEAGRQRVARWLWFAMVFLFVISIIGSIFVFLFIPDPLDDITPLLVILPTTLMVMFFLRRGKESRASFVLIAGLWFMVTFGSARFDGVRGAYAHGLLTLLFMAGLLLGIRQGLIFSGLSAISLIGLALLETNGFIPNVEPLPVWIMTIALLGNVVMITAILFLSLQSIHNHVDRLDAEKASQKALNDELEEAQHILEGKSQELAAVNESLEQRVAARTREIELVNQLGNVLQTCQSFEEAYRAIGLSLQNLFPSDRVELYVFRSSKNKLEAVANSMGEPNNRPFLPEECWSLRMGKPYRYAPGKSDLQCYHIDAEDESSSLCVPLTAQSEILGVFHIAQTADQAEESRVQQTRLVLSLANRIAMAISNLQLQESLRAQAIRDPLTGLYNRRYMEEAIERDLARAQRRDQKVAVLMLDIDHFKDFNDSFGHDAGDAVLQEIGGILKKNVRGEDIPCRYGGEEFVIIMPEARLADGYARAQDLSEKIRTLSLVHEKQYLGGITVSVGVAIFPDHGPGARQVLKAADLALYLAKANGRDCVKVFE